MNSSSSSITAPLGFPTASDAALSAQKMAKKLKEQMKQRQQPKQTPSTPQTTSVVIGKGGQPKGTTPSKPAATGSVKSPAKKKKIIITPPMSLSSSSPNDEDDEDDDGGDEEGEEEEEEDGDDLEEEKLDPNDPYAKWHKERGESDSFDDYFDEEGDDDDEEEGGEDDSDDDGEGSDDESNSGQASKKKKGSGGEMAKMATALTSALSARLRDFTPFEQVAPTEEDLRLMTQRLNNLRSEKVRARTLFSVSTSLKRPRSDEEDTPINWDTGIMTAEEEEAANAPPPPPPPKKRKQKQPPPPPAVKSVASQEDAPPPTVATISAMLSNLGLQANPAIEAKEREYLEAAFVLYRHGVELMLGPVPSVPNARLTNVGEGEDSDAAATTSTVRPWSVQLAHRAKTNKDLNRVLSVIDQLVPSSTV